MSTALYNEAIADAKELVRMAEQNATNKLVEAVAPRIRRLVEKKLLNEEMEDEESEMMPSGEDEEPDDAEFISSDPEEESEGEDDEVPSDDDFSMGDDDMTALGSMFSSDSEEDDDDMLGDFEGGMRIPSDRVKRISIEFDEGDKPKNVKSGKSKGDKPILRSNEGMELTKESISTLLRIVDGSGTITDRIKEARLDLKVTGRALGALNEGRVRRGAALRIVESFNGVLRRALALQAEVAQLPRGPMRDSATRQLSTLTKEIKEMSTRSMLRALLEREEMKKGNEGREEEGHYAEMYEADEEEAAAEEDGEEAADEGGDMSPEDVLGKIKDLLDQMGGEEAAEEETEEETEEEEEAATEGDHYEMMSHGNMMESRRRRRDPVYTIDESMLRRELFRLRRLREEVEPTDSFGGPPEEEEDLESVLTSDLNVYGDDLGSVSEAKKADAKMKKMKEAEKAKAAKEAKEKELKEKEKELKEKEKEKEKMKMKEARMNRALKSRLSEAVTAINSLRRELNEQKLFNAKLLYVNKLMQNKAISERQLRSIVEALDGAGTLREAQLLYKSLTESLSRSSGGNLTEGANRIAGNSSRSTRPGGLVNESVEVDRWAVLAGLKG